MKQKEFWISEAMGQGEYDNVFFGNKPDYWHEKLNVNQFHAIDYSEYEKLKKALEKICGMCGHPDSSQACRNILEYIAQITKGL